MSSMPAEREHQDPTQLIGSLVEINGVEFEVEPVAYDGNEPATSSPFNVNGCHGRVIDWVASVSIYFIHILDGYWVHVPDKFVTKWTPKSPEEGGFDFLWPSDVGSLPHFAAQVSSVLEAKGWCMIQMFMSDASCASAQQEAENMTGFRSPNEEFILDVFGRGGSGKFAIVDDSTSGSDLRMDASGSTLSKCNDDLTILAESLAPIAPAVFGFDCSSRTDGMVWLPFENALESQLLPPGPLTRDDIDEGKVDDHLDLIRRRRLCMMYLVETAGGELLLHPKNGVVKLPINRKNLLVFRHDLMNFTYTPSDYSVAVLAWTLTSLPVLELSSITCDATCQNYLRGLIRGPQPQHGEVVRIMSLMTRWPGDAFGPNKYWNMLTIGTDASHRIPMLRFDVDLYCASEKETNPMGKSTTVHGGFCSEEEIYSFDFGFFDMNEEEAASMAPAQRVLVETGYQCLDMAHSSEDVLVKQSCGVFVGDSGSDWWPIVVADTGRLHSPLAQGSSSNCTTASRLSHILGLRGPVNTVDTACSSSLVATGIAISGLLRPAARSKLAAHMPTLREALGLGINAITSPYLYVVLSGPHMLSTRGRCFTFDSTGDGYERGEGSGAVLMRISEDWKDAQKQFANVVGSCINQDGKSATLTAPNGPAQSTCINASLLEARVSTNEVAIAECHGTGTMLGDPIEVGALHKVMQPRLLPLMETSAKSNMGHLEAGAGLSGLTKCIVMLLGSCGTPNCHLGQLNPHFNLTGSPAIYQTECTDVSLNCSIAGVSSFGFGGTNGRCDLWGECMIGPHSAEKTREDGLDQMLLAVTCPITLGPIDYLSGEPVLNGEHGRKRARAAVLREELASYEVSSLVYSGGYRLGGQVAIGDEILRLPHNTKIYVCGSWSAWKTFEAMQEQQDGSYAITMHLGEGCYELFYICLDCDEDRCIYPIINNASDKIWIEGPDKQRHGQKWIIDGRPEGIAAGTEFQILFKFGRRSKSIEWCQTGRSKPVDTHHHVYSVAGSWTSWNLEDLSLSHSTDTWEGHVKIGISEQEEFVFVRDHDWQQVIYPSTACAFETSIPACGPDNLWRHGKHWQIHGPSGDDVKLKLLIAEGTISFTALLSNGLKHVWESENGWERHEYFVVGQLTDGLHAKMNMDHAAPGVFKCQVSLADHLSSEFQELIGEFHIQVDKDPDLALYPERADANASESIVSGPDSSRQGRNWMIRIDSFHTGILEIVLNLTLHDRRKRVKWNWL